MTSDIVFIILLAFLLVVAIGGLISAELGYRRRNRQLAKLIALLHFDHEVCGKCEHRTDCPIYTLAMDSINKRCHKHQG